jgi:hypothetical protein
MKHELPILGRPGGVLITADRLLAELAVSKIVKASVRLMATRKEKTEMNLK